MVTRVLCAIAWLMPSIVTAGESLIDAQDFTDCIVLQTQRLETEPVLRNSLSLKDVRADFLPTVEASAAINKATPSVLSTGSSATISVRQKLFAASTSAAIDAANSSLRSSQFELVQKSFQNAVDALDSLIQFQRLIELERLTRIQAQSYDFATRLLSVSAKVGVSDSYDYLQSKSALIANQTEVNRLQFEVERAKQEFTIRFGFSPLDPTSIGVKTIDRELAFDQFPEVKSLRAQAKLAQDQNRQQAREIWPELSLTASFSNSVARDQGVNSHSVTEGAAIVSLDLSGLWKNAGKTTTYDAIVDQKRNLLELRKSTLKNEFTQIENELSLLKTQIPLLNERVQLSNKSREVSKAKLRLGRVSFLELQQTETSAYTASQDLFTASLREKQLQLLKFFGLRFTKETPRSDVQCRLKRS